MVSKESGCFVASFLNTFKIKVKMKIKMKLKMKMKMPTMVMLLDIMFIYNHTGEDGQVMMTMIAMMMITVRLV